MPIKAGWRKLGSATDNVSHTRDYLLAQGFRPTRSKFRWCAVFPVRDPEGNPIAFVHRPAPKAGYGPPSRQLASHLIHAGFVVKDLGATNRFYVELLGFRLYWQGGFKDNSIDWYELQVPDGPDWIEYMLNIPADADHHELGVQNHFSFGVKDVHAAAAKLRARGGKHSMDPRLAATVKTVWMPTIRMERALRSWSSPPCRSHVAIPTQQAIRSRDGGRLMQKRQNCYKTGTTKRKPQPIVDTLT